MLVSVWSGGNDEGDVNAKPHCALQYRRLQSSTILGGHWPGMRAQRVQRVGIHGYHVEMEVHAPMDTPGTRGSKRE